LGTRNNKDTIKGGCIMVYADNYVIEFIKNNFVSLTFLYLILKSLWPESMILKAIGDAFKNTFGKKSQV